MSAAVGCPVGAAFAVVPDGFAGTAVLSPGAGEVAVVCAKDDTASEVAAEIRVIVREVFMDRDSASPD